MSYQRMPFGKFKGVFLSDLPSTYIVYALESFDLPFELNEELKNILVNRFYIFNDAEAENSVDNSVLSKIYKELAKKYHPDAGGSHDAMIAINEFYELLK